MTTEVKLEGKLFTQPQPVTNYHVNVMTKELAQQAEMAVKFQGQSSFRYERSLPTGNWSRSIKIRQSRGSSGRYQTGWAVHDSGIIYGPWLEGEGSRNVTSRFKGYRTFRKVAQQIDRQAPDLLLQESRRYARDLES